MQKCFSPLISHQFDKTNLSINKKYNPFELCMSLKANENKSIMNSDLQHWDTQNQPKAKLKSVSKLKASCLSAICVLNWERVCKSSQGLATHASPT